MREIKFRAWNGYKMYSPTIEGDCDISEYLSKTENIMQYTGLKDKNGVDIYEGDILKEEFGINNRSHWHYEVKFGLYYNGLEYEDAIKGCGFYAFCLNNIYDDLSDVSDFEVVGNIYENPELLKDNL